MVCALLAGCGPRVLFSGEAPGLGPVFVVQEHGRRALRFGRPDAEDQSVYDPRRPGHEPLPYIRSALVAVAYAGDAPGRLLMIGLGGGSYLRHVHELAPRMSLEAVEISPLVVQVCRRFFVLPERVKVHVGDGRRFVERTDRRYRLVFIDAYDSVDYPRHLGTRGFFSAVRRIVAPGGVVVANLSPNTDAMRADLVRTFRAVFPEGPCLATANDNTVLLGQVPPGSTPQRVRHRLAALERRSSGRHELVQASRRTCQLELEGARVLDD